MAWVPYTAVAHSFDSLHVVPDGAGHLTFVADETADNPAFTLEFSDVHQVRITAVSYLAGQGRPGAIYEPAYFEFNWGSIRQDNEAPPYPAGNLNSSGDGVTDFMPHPLEVDEVEQLAFFQSYVTSDFLMGEDEFVFSVEVWQEAVLQANDDEASTLAQTPVTVDVLANDTLDDAPVQLFDLAGPPVITQPPAHGAAVPNPDGTITYTPPPGFCGYARFEYEIEEALG